MTLRLFVLLSLPLLAHAEFPKPYNTEKGDPMPAAEAAASMQLPPGFKCEVFAAEPDVQQPIALAWDPKGRLWIAECYTYAENPSRWDTKLRDRIIIFEDKDNDGHQDGRKVFYDNATYLTSIEYGYGGVWMLAEGGLSFIPDKNQDDVPDGPPEMLLDGFNTKTIGHNIVNGLRWGPDGWLYGRHGITDTSAIGAPGTPLEKRARMNCGLWRYHPTRKVFEVVLNGGTNSWGHDWDANGELFWINTVIGHLWHGIPGSYTDRMFGTHLNTHVYETIPMIADHYHFDIGNEKWSDIRNGISSKTSSLGGGHAHVGMMIYNGGLWPEQYKGRVFTCNLHGNRINVDRLDREGCGFVGKHEPDFMQSKDKWFRGIDLTTGPDGNVFVLDWSDSGECHDNDGVHRTSGRIYKIVYGEPKKMELFNLLSVAPEDHGQYFQRTNLWWPRMSSQALLALGTSVPRSVRVGVASGDSSTYLQAALTNAQDLLSGVPIEPAELDRKDDAFVCTWIDGYIQQNPIGWIKASAANPARNAAEAKDQQRDLLEVTKAIASQKNQLQKLADHRSGLVRLHIASALQRLPLEARWPIATALAQHEEDAKDRQQPLMIWYGIEPAVAADPAKGIELVASAKLPTVRRLVTRRITEDYEKNGSHIDSLVALAIKNDVARTDILAGMSAALKGVASAPKPKAWDELAAKAGKAPEVADLSLVFGSGRAMDDLAAIVSNIDADANARSSAFASLLRNPKPELFQLVRGMINDKVLGTDARLGMAKFGDQDVPKSLLNNWPDRSIEWRAANVTTMVSRANWAKALLEAVAKKPTMRADISPYQARQIRSLGDEALSKLLAETWGELRDTPEAKKAELLQWKQSLTADALAKADAAKGKSLFTATCSACHKLFGQGGQIGPDLTGSDRHNLDYLLGNIVDPNAMVPADFRVSIFKLKDGRTISGVIPEQNDRTLTVQTPAERLTIERTQITEQSQLPVSLMPEGLLPALGQENVAHLVKYLMSN